MENKDNKINLSEEDIKRRYITPAIAGKWSDSQILMEYGFTDGRVMLGGNQTCRGRRKRADYLLSYKNNLPLAVVEAKDNSPPVRGGLQQAVAYAEILDVPFAYSSNGDAFMERDRHSGTERRLALSEFPTPDKLWARYRQIHGITDSEERIITEPFHFQIGDKSARYYQQIAINRAVEAVSKGRKRNCLRKTEKSKKAVLFHQSKPVIRHSTFRKDGYRADLVKYVQKLVQEAHFLVVERYIQQRAYFF